MTELEVELAALRQRRPPRELGSWLRQFRPFDRRAIRDPDERDIYWVNIQRRLAESDAAFLTRFDPYPSSGMAAPDPEPVGVWPAGALIGDSVSARD